VSLGAIPKLDDFLDFLSLLEGTRGFGRGWPTAFHSISFCLLTSYELLERAAGRKSRRQVYPRSFETPELSAAFLRSVEALLLAHNL